jgi:glycolate oxidase
MLNETILSELRAVTGEENLLTSPEARVCYSFDGTFQEALPDAIASPQTTDQVSGILKICNRERVAVITRGMGSGLAAATVPFGGGLVLNMVRMNHILEIDRANMMARVEAGVITADFQAEVEKLGLFYPPDPSSIRHSTMGGNVACNAGGPRCLKYGVTGDYVKGLRVVLADGRILWTGGKPIKNATGYNLSQLFVGSEGTLGVVTEVLVKLKTRPRYVRTATAVFDNLDVASSAVSAVLEAGLLPATMEMMDNTTINTIEDYLHMGLPREAEAILIIESDGSDAAAVEREIEGTVEVCRTAGAVEVRIASNEAERNELWRARRSVSGSLARKRPNKLGEDISVPRSAIPETVRRIKEIALTHNLPIVVFGHAGDGNLHPNILFDKRDPDEWARVQRAVADIFRLAVEVGGTLSGEHGVGTLKKPYLESAVGPLAIDVMRSVRRALDPNGILNPGKVFD